MNLRKGDWRGKTAPPLGHDPEGKILGILGMGGIGRDLKKKAEALGMTVQYHNRNPLSAEMSGGAKYVGFEQLLETSDIISLNVPLNVSAFLSGLNPPFSLFSQAYLRSLEIHPPHDLHPPIPEDERQRRHNQYRAWRRNRRSRSRQSPRRRQSLLRGPGRLRRRAEDPSRPGGEPACAAATTYGNSDCGDPDQDGAVEY